MSGMIPFAKRNLKIYFKDRTSVFFSLMAVLIVIMLYLLFLRDMLIDNISSGMEMVSPDQVSNLVDCMVLAGILSIVSVTTSAGSLQIMIEDKVSGRGKDFDITPIRSWEVAGGYILSTFLVGMIMGAISFAISIVYLLATDTHLEFGSIVICLLLLIPSSLSGSIIIYALTSFFKSNGAYSGFYTVMSVLIGFLTGIYMPMGVMPDAIRVIGTLLPASHMASLFRQYLGQDVMKDIFGDYDISSFRGEMGIDLYIGDYVFTPAVSLIYVSVITAIFFGIAVFRLQNKK